MPVDNSIPAFPLPAGPDGDRDWNRSGGLSMRDYFAAKAMGSMLRDTVADEAFETYQQLAKDAYAMADAMLAERERERES